MRPCLFWWEGIDHSGLCIIGLPCNHAWTCIVYCSQSLNWAVWWECHVPVTAGDTWHKMRHGCVTEMSGWRVCRVLLATGPCKHKQWGRCSLAPSPGLATSTTWTIQFYKCCSVTLSQCHSRQTKQNTGHTQGSMNARVRCTPTTNTCFLFCIFQHLNQSGKKCKRIQHREERLIIDWWNHIILEYLRERSPLLFYLIRNYLFKNCWHFTKFVYPDDMISTFIKAK